jgi:hypothetical protein
MSCIAIAIVALALGLTAARADTVKIPKSVIEAGWKKAECTVDLKEVDDEQEAQPLGGKLKLVEVYCWRAAYQAGSIFFVVDPAAPEKAQLARFRTWETARKTLGWTYSLTSPDYDAASHKLSMAHKGRGVGDCGETGRWTWTGMEFRLTSYSSKPKCDGEPFDDDKKWQVYPPRRKR